MAGACDAIRCERVSARAIVRRRDRGKRESHMACEELVGGELLPL